MRTFCVSSSAQWRLAVDLPPVGAGSMWQFGQHGSEHIQATREYWSALERFTYGFYVNDLEPDATTASIQATYRQNHDRLVAVMNGYDPTNLFRMNANVKPTV